MNVNKVFLAGHLTRDPELKTLRDGTAVANFGIAVNGRPYQKNGETVRDTNFVDLEAWSSGAERIAEYFKKGDPIYIDGQLKQESWTDNEGKRRSRMKVRVLSFEFVRPKVESQKGESAMVGASDQNEFSNQNDDQEIPF